MDPLRTLLLALRTAFDAYLAATVADPGAETPVTPDPLPEPLPEPLPQPPAVPVKRLGTNIMPVTDWDTTYPFTNFMRRARVPFSGPLYGWSDSRALNVDAQGNILSLASDQAARFVLFTAARPAETFTLRWAGEGSFAVDNSTGITRTANSLSFKPNPSGTVTLTLTNVNAANPPKNLDLRPASLTDVTSQFNPVFLDEVKRYGIIRFMDWQAVNFVRTPGAKDFDAARAQYTEAAVPLSVMIALANEAKADPWFCIHHLADQAYVDQFLAEVKTKLAPDRKAYIELSNEVWNSAFPQYRGIGRMGTGTDNDQAMRAYALKAADLAAKARAVLGDRCVTVLGAQSPATYWQQELINMIKAAGKPLPNVLSTAPYFGSGLPDAGSVFDDGSLLREAQEAVAEAKASKAVAVKNGMGFVMYEAGQHLVPGTVVNRDARFEAVYDAYLKGLAEAGTLVHYALVSPYGSSGAWGAAESIYNLDTPKNRALRRAAV